jgi:hypothetical protein
MLLQVQEWSFMMRGAPLALVDSSANPTWLSGKQWSEICWLNANVPSMHGVRQSILDSGQAWQIWLQQGRQDAALPGGMCATAFLDHSEVELSVSVTKLIV